MRVIELKENDLIRYMFVQNETNFDKLGKNSDAIRKLTERKSEKEVVGIMFERIEILYGGIHHSSTSLWHCSGFLFPAYPRSITDITTRKNGRPRA